MSGRDKYSLLFFGDDAAGLGISLYMRRSPWPGWSCRSKKPNGMGVYDIMKCS